MNRNVAIAAGVIVFHAAALWALQNGLLRPAVELRVPAEVLVAFIAPAAAQVRPFLPAPPKPSPVQAPTTTQPLAITDTAPAANAAPVAAIAATPAAPAAAVTPAVAAPIRVQLPSTDADYLQNPKPGYPPLSKRLGEQGHVVLRVFIEVDGKAQKAEIKQSSGFERLDQAALNTVLRWRYVSGKRDGAAQAMWFNVPISFVLE